MTRTPMILIAEDEQSIRDCVREVLEMEGYEVQTAVDGMDAWQRLNAQGRKPDLLITDIMMPNMDGYELIERIRNHVDLKYMSVICFTATRNIRSRLADSQCIHVTKPFDLDELLGAIESCCVNNNKPNKELL